MAIVVRRSAGQTGRSCR